MMEQPVHAAWGWEDGPRRLHFVKVAALGAADRLEDLADDGLPTDDREILALRHLAAGFKRPAPAKMGRPVVKVPPPVIEVQGDSVKVGSMVIAIRKVDPKTVWPFTETSMTVPGWKRITAAVCAMHGVTIPEVMGQSRNRQVVACRHEIFYRLSKESGFSLPQIGSRFGGRDHTTVLHGIRKHQERMAEAAAKEGEAA